MKNILCFGDSNTYGYDPSNGGRFDWGIMWTSILERKLNKKDIRIIDEGLVGRTTVFDDPLRPQRSGADTLRTVIEMHRPIDTVILMLGTNDCKTAYGTDEYKIGRGIEYLLDIIAETTPESKVLLISPIALGEGVWEDGYDTEFSKQSVKVSKRLPKVYRNIAKKRGIDFLAASDYAHPSETDREHLDARGHARLARAILDKLYEMEVVSYDKQRKIG